VIELIAEPGRHRRRLTRLLASTSGTVRVASAYVTDRDLLLSGRARDVRLVTSLSTMDVVSGATSLDSLGVLIESGVQCKSVADGPRLHAKVYIFGTEVAVVSSANLTESALDRNIEVGVEVRGGRVAELAAWYERLWKTARCRIDSALLADLRHRSAQLRREYVALRRRSNTLVRSTQVRQASDSPVDDLAALFANARQFFVCNTNRRHADRTPSGGFLLEERMRRRGYAAAWNGFKFDDHIQRVQPGDAIFMFAKGVGIIGIGRAKASHQALQPGSADRLYDEDSVEWRVPVDWLDWREPEDACALDDEAYNFSFWSVSADNYSRLRQRVKEHFLGSW
jgi:hypothetical protein